MIFVDLPRLARAVGSASAGSFGRKLVSLRVSPCEWIFAFPVHQVPLSSGHFSSIRRIIPTYFTSTPSFAGNRHEVEEGPTPASQ